MHTYNAEHNGNEMVTVVMPAAWQEHNDRGGCREVRLISCIQPYVTIRRAVIQRETNASLDALNEIFGRFEQSQFLKAQVQAQFTAFCEQRSEQIRHTALDYAENQFSPIDDIIWDIACQLFTAKATFQRLQILMPSLKNVLQLDVCAQFSNEQNALLKRHNLHIALDMQSIDDAVLDEKNQGFKSSWLSLVMGNLIVGDDAIFDLKQMTSFDFLMMHSLYYELARYPEIRQELFQRNNGFQKMHNDIMRVSAQLLTPRHALSELSRQLEAVGERTTGNVYAGDYADSLIFGFHEYLTTLPANQRKAVLKCAATRKILHRSEANTTVTDVIEYLVDPGELKCAEVTSACFLAILSNRENDAALDNITENRERASIRELNRDYKKESRVVFSLMEPKGGGYTDLPVKYLREIYAGNTIIDISGLTLFLLPMPTDCALSALLAVDIDIENFEVSFAAVESELLFQRMKKPLAQYMSHDDCQINIFTRVSWLVRHGEYESAIRLCRSISWQDYTDELSTEFKVSATEYCHGYLWRLMVVSFALHADEKTITQYISCLDKDVLQRLLSVEAHDVPGLPFMASMFGNNQKLQIFIIAAIANLETAEEIVAFLTGGTSEDSMVMDWVGHDFKLTCKAIIEAIGVHRLAFVLRAIDAKAQELYCAYDCQFDILELTLSEQSQLVLQYCIHESEVTPGRPHVLSFVNLAESFSLQDLLPLTYYIEKADKLFYLMSMLAYVEKEALQVHLPLELVAKHLANDYFVADQNRQLLQSIAQLHSAVVHEYPIIEPLDDFKYAVMLKAYADSGLLFVNSNNCFIEEIMASAIKKRAGLICHVLAMTIPDDVARSIKLLDRPLVSELALAVNSGYRYSLVFLLMAMHICTNDQFKQFVSQLDEKVLTHGFSADRRDEVSHVLKSTGPDDRILQSIKNNWYYYIAEMLERQANPALLQAALILYFNQAKSFASSFGSEILCRAVQQSVPTGLLQAIRTDQLDDGLLNLWLIEMCCDTTLGRLFARSYELDNYTRLIGFLASSGILDRRARKWQSTESPNQQRYERFFGPAGIARCLNLSRRLEDASVLTTDPFVPPAAVRSQYDAFLDYSIVDGDFDVLYSFMIAEMVSNVLLNFLNKAEAISLTFFTRIAEQCPITLHTIARLLSPADFIVLIEKYKLELNEAIIDAMSTTVIQGSSHSHREQLSVLMQSHPRLALAVELKKLPSLRECKLWLAGVTRQNVLSLLYQRLSTLPPRLDFLLFHRCSHNDVRLVIKLIEQQSDVSIATVFRLAFDTLLAEIPAIEEQFDEHVATYSLTRDILKLLIDSVESASLLEHNTVAAHSMN